ncbi:MAG: hypothetical protein ACRD4O_07390 [Bryobacteraceae bacterium]
MLFTLESGASYIADQTFDLVIPGTLRQKASNSGSVFHDVDFSHL